MSIQIPSKKSQVLIDYHGTGRLDGERPALNVKHYGQVEYTTERVAQEFGCDQLAAERAVQWCYESAQEQFWEQALDSLNFAMLGEQSEKYQPVGLAEGPFKVLAEGRSGGWLVVEGLPDVSTWNGTQFMKWRKFARMLKDEMKFLASWEYAKDMIDANEWAPKASTSAANRENARAAPIDRLAKAARAIHGELDGCEWDGADCLARIADHLRDAGLEIAEPEDE